MVLMRALITIGIGKRDVDEFILQLREKDIDYLIDIRSSPYSKYKPEFNKEPFSNSLKRAGIKYGYWGDSLGGLPDDPYILTNGRVDYGKLARRPNFIQGLERLISALENDYKIVIFCSEGRPEQCHRTKCIAVEMVKREVDVFHIDFDNELVSQAEVMRRIQSDQVSLPGLEAPLVSKRRWDTDDDE